MYDSNYITFWKKQNRGDSKKISGCQELGEGMSSGVQWDVRAVNTLYDTLMTNTCHFSFVETHRIYNTASEP